MKKIVSFVMTLVLMLCLLPTAALSVGALISGDYYYVVLDDGTAEIYKYDGVETDLVLPSILDGYTVTSIRDLTFQDHASLTSVVIPNTVTTIGTAAFRNCDSLTYAKIGAAVNGMGGSVFADCDSLTYIDVDSESPYWMSVDGVVYDCTKMCLLYYPIGRKDTVFTVPDGVEWLSAPFQGSDTLEIINLPETITIVGGYCFRDCISLQHVNLPDSIYALGDGAFQGCTSLQEITLPKGISTIRYEMFNGCSSLKSVTIPDSIETIEYWAFMYCTALESIVIPDSVTTIDDRVFYGCKSLKYVSLPASVTSIDYGQFGYCESVTVFGYTDSYVEQYCMDVYYGSDLTFVAIGDVDENGKIGLNDAARAYYALNGKITLSEGEQMAADCYYDGKTDVADVQRIVSAAMGGERPLSP